MTSSRVGSSGDLFFTFFFFGFFKKNAERKNLSFMYLSLSVLRFRIESEFMAVFFILYFAEEWGELGERGRRSISSVVEVWFIYPLKTSNQVAPF